MKLSNIVFSVVLASSSLGLSSVLSFSNANFVATPSYSGVSTFSLSLDLTSNLLAGASFNDPSLSDIQYGVSGSLTSTPSGFPAFAFNLSDRFPSSPPITGAQFYGQNSDSPADGKIRFNVLAGADLSDGLQLDELAAMSLTNIDYLSAGTGSSTATASGSNVIFHFNGREEGTGRYHPTFIRLYADGTGIIMNADNMGGDNPMDSSPNPIDVDFGEEYVTNLTFNASTVTISPASVPEPSGVMLFSLGGLAFFVRRR